MSFYNLPEPSMSFCKLPWVKWIINRTQNYAQQSDNNWSCLLRLTSLERVEHFMSLVKTLTLRTKLFYCYSDSIYQNMLSYKMSFDHEKHLFYLKAKFKPFLINPQDSII